MSVETAAKEFIRTATTAGLSKDVIDLLEKKAALLTQQIAVLETENSTLTEEVSRLKTENAQLKNELRNSQPKSNPFHSALGVLWKRAGNGFERVPYCPQCPAHTVLFGQPPMGGDVDPAIWQCSKCGFIASFSGRP